MAITGRSKHGREVDIPALVTLLLFRTHVDDVVRVWADWM